MFATINDVSTITGKLVTDGLISRAQSLLEMYVNKSEAEITKTKDIALMKKAVAYQCAYMVNNEEIVFEQIAARAISQNDSYITFRNNEVSAPWIAPLALITCNRLSFARSRTVVTGKINPSSTVEVAWETI